MKKNHFTNKCSSFFLASLCCLLFVACGSKLPECGDPKATDLAKQIVSNSIYGDEIGKNFTKQVVIEAIETRSKDEKLLQELLSI